MYLRRYVPLVAMTIVGIATELVAAQVPILDFGIANDPSYLAFRNATYQSEYVRVDYALHVKPRVVATTTALMVFATNNPLATAADLQNFVDAYNHVLETFSANDPDLVRKSDFLAAVRRNERVEAAGIFTGVDTRVGTRVLELLGVDIPPPAGFDSTRHRMVDFDNARIRSFTDSPTWSQILLLGFFGQDLAGHVNANLSSVLEAYLVAQGFEPVPDGTPDDSRFDAVTDALNQMPPDFAAYSALLDEIDTNASNLDATSLQDSIQASFENIRAENARLLNEVTAGMVNPPSVVDAAANAQNAAYVAQIVNEYEQNVLAVSGDRAKASWNAMILLQSDQAEARNYATSARSFLNTQLQTDNTLAEAKAGIQIVSGVATFGAGVAKGDPGNFISGLTDVTLGSLDLADALGAFQDQPPSPDQQIFDQMVEVRKDVDALRVQMHDRFDQVEAQLNLIFVSMVDSFDAMGNQIGALQSSVEDLSRAMAVQRATLDRLEDALWGVAQDILLHDLTTLTDLVLNYRGSGIDLPYGTSSPNFVEAASNLATWATTTSAATTFAGPTVSPLTSFDDAVAVLSDDSIGRNVNDLRVFPTTLGLPALLSDRVVAAAPWSQSASAYVQLSKESPWYFAYLYEHQSNSAVADLDAVVAKGEDLAQMMTNGHSPALMEALLNGYKSTMEDLRDTEGQIIQGVRDDSGANVDPWGGLTQPQVAGYLPPVPVLDGVGTSSANLEMPQNASSWNIFHTGNNQKDIAELSMALVSRETGKLHITPIRRYEWNMNLFAVPHNDQVLFNLSFVINGSNGGAHPELNAKTVRQLRLKFSAYGSSVRFNNESDAEDFFGDDVLFWRRVRAHLLTDQNLAGTTITEKNANNDVIDIEVISDAHWQGDTSGKTVVQQQLQNLQLECWDAAVNSSGITQLGNQLLDWETLLDAYVTLSMPSLLETSTVARSALRGVPSEDSLALAVDVHLHYMSNLANPTQATFIWDRLYPAWDMTWTTIHNGLNEAPSGHGYIDYVLSELYALRENAFKLAIDDRYETTGVLSKSAQEGLLSNDINQAYRTIEIDSYTQPVDGSVTVAPDGSFTFTPTNGFYGEMSFTYRSRSDIYNDPSAVFVTDPATVVVQVYCPADLDRDGQGNLVDFSMLADCIGPPGQPLAPGCRTADADQDGDADLADLAMFQTKYGCP